MFLLYSYLVIIINFKAKFFLSSYINFTLVYIYTLFISLLKEIIISLTLLIKRTNTLSALIAIKL